MGNVAIIPARGGSKRIPNKNIKPFIGKPIIAYSIEAALETAIFTRIIVSTDSEEIAEVARHHGAEVPFFRPAELSDDYTGTDAVIAHSLRWLLDRGEAVNTICCIYATAPFIRPEYIIQGYDLLTKHGVDACFSVTTFPYPIFRALKLTGKGHLAMFWPEHFMSRSQDLPQAYHDAGQFYWSTVHRYIREKTFLSDDTCPVILPRHLVQDIDTPEDWTVAEIIYRTLMGQRKETE